MEEGSPLKRAEAAYWKALHEHENACEACFKAANEFLEALETEGKPLVPPQIALRAHVRATSTTSSCNAQRNAYYGAVFDFLVANKLLPSWAHLVKLPLFFLRAFLLET